jgi:hypothetical protein
VVAATCRAGDGGAVPRLGRRQQWTEVAGDMEQSSEQERGRVESVKQMRVSARRKRNGERAPLAAPTSGDKDQPMCCNGHRRPPAASGSLRGQCDHRAKGGRTGSGTEPGGEFLFGPLTGGPGPVKISPRIFKLHLNL